MEVILKALASLLLPAAVLVADAAVASPHERKEDCAAIYALNGYTGIALPLNGGTNLDTYRNQICYMGEDVTQAAAGYDLSLTSGINGVFTGGKVALIAVNKPRHDGKGEPEAAIVLLQAEGKTLNRRVLATSALDTDPAISIEGFHIGGYDSLRSLAYFEAHTGANASYIYTFDMAAVLQGEAPRAKFFAYGSVEYVDGHYLGASTPGTGSVIVSRLETVDGRGRDEVLYMLGKDGKEICKVNPENRRSCIE